jgi:hypothetical protein
VTTPDVPYDPSKAALAPLMETFWEPAGWRRSPTWPVPEVMAAAIAAGVMFGEPRTEDHDGWVQAARDAAGRLSAAAAGEAFLASLSSRRMDLRSALGSYAVARRLPEHAFVPASYSSRCAICGQSDGPPEPEDLNVFSFERFKWGGVRHDDAPYEAFDLEQFRRAPRLAATRADIDLGQQVIDQLRRLPPGTTAARASRHLKMIKGNKDERDVILDILGLCGILRAGQHPGYADAYIPYAERTWPGKAYPFAGYPIWWWTAADGVSDHALHTFFPQLT